MEALEEKPKDLDIPKFVGADSMELLEAVQIMQSYIHFKGNIELHRMKMFVQKYEKRETIG